ncbi:MAG: leucine-rich repeat domain-containing protein, partial [Gemmatimonadetes bacterium]|nr:leucine-rich repeat domain-containing protein [Gemmatimonadota bacterium]
MALAIGSGCRDPVDPAGDLDPGHAGDLDPGHAGDRRPDAAMTGQLDVLVAVYWKTGGENWNNNTNWLTDEPLNDWYGVSADTSGNVVGLDLGDNGLTGSIPAELGDLESLRKLHLYSNDLTGSIPAELGDLDSLRELDLSNNDLTGPIP